MSTERDRIVWAIQTLSDHGDTEIPYDELLDLIDRDDRHRAHMFLGRLGIRWHERLEEQRQVSCPTCRAKPGSRCTAKGQVVANHKSRIAKRERQP